MLKLLLVPQAMLPHRMEKYPLSWVKLGISNDRGDQLRYAVMLEGGNVGGRGGNGGCGFGGGRGGGGGDGGDNQSEQAPPEPRIILEKSIIEKGLSNLQRTI